MLAALHHQGIPMPALVSDGPRGEHDRNMSFIKAQFDDAGGVPAKQVEVVPSAAVAA